MSLTRERLAQEAARLLLEYGESNLNAALHKAAQRLDIKERRLWPNRSELETAIRRERSLFARPEQVVAVNRLRKAALGLMRLLANYQPHLSGALLQDYGGQNSPIELHLFCEGSEAILLHLLELGIPYTTRARNFRYPDGSSQEIPLFELRQDEMLAELLCFPLKERQGAAPLAPLSQTKVTRLSISGLEQLLAEEVD